MRGAKVVVVGSGVAGLTAGYELQKAGHDVTVLERASTWGGRMSNEMLGSLRVVTGATIFSTMFDDMMELIRDLGIEDRVRKVPEGEAATLVTRDLEHYANMRGGPLDLFRSPALSLRSKLRLPLIAPDLLRARKKTDPNLAHTAEYLDDGENMGQYVGRVVGEDFVENFLEPFFRANWSWEPEDISKGYFLSVAARMGKKYMTFWFDDGQSALTDELASRLDVRTSTTVTEIGPREIPGRIVRYVDESGVGEIEADAVVFAAYADLAPELITDLDPDERAFFSTVRYNPVAIIHYVLNQAPAAMEKAFCRSHPSKFAIVHTTPGTPGVVGEPHRAYFELSPQAVEEYRSGDYESMDEYARPYAREFVSDLDRTTIEVHEQWWDRMLVTFYPGYIRGMATFLRGQDQRARTDLVFCGDYLSHSHTGGACASGRRVGRALARRLAKIEVPDAAAA